MDDAPLSTPVFFLLIQLLGDFCCNVATFAALFLCIIFYKICEQNQLITKLF